MPVLARGAEEVVPALGRVAEPEGARGLAPDPASLEIGAGALRLRPVPEPRLEAARGPLHEREEPVAGAGLRRRLAARQGDARPVGQEAHRLGEVETIVAAQELEGIAAGVAAEAVEEVQLRVDREGGRLLLVEGAEALPALAGALERHDRPHEVHEIHARPDLVQDLGGHSHRLALRPGTARGPRRRREPLGRRAALERHDRDAGAAGRRLGEAEAGRPGDVRGDTLPPRAGALPFPCRGPAGSPGVRPAPRRRGTSRPPRAPRPT